jgi:hypothetical protein
MLSALQALDPEVTSHAELERCKKLASGIKTALRALTPSEPWQVRSGRIEDVRATIDAVVERRLELVRQQEERRAAQKQMLREEFSSSPGRSR